MDTSISTLACIVFDVSKLFGRVGWVGWGGGEGEAIKQEENLAPFHVLFICFTKMVCIHKNKHKDFMKYIPVSLSLNSVLH